MTFMTEMGRSWGHRSTNQRRPIAREAKSDGSLLGSIEQYLPNLKRFSYEVTSSHVEALMNVQGTKRLLLTGNQRRLLAAKGKSLGRKALMELTTIVTLIDPGDEVGLSQGEIQCRERLGGILRYYYHDAA